MARICPNCGNNTQENFCSECGNDLRQQPITPKSSRTQAPISPYNQFPQDPNQPYPQPPQTSYPQYPPSPIYSGIPIETPLQPPKPEWYKDGSIIGLILLGISLILIWDVFFLALVLSVLALILAVRSKKSGGRIPVVTTIFGVIILIVELAITLLLLLTVSILGGMF